MAAKTWQNHHPKTKQIYTVSGINVTPGNLQQLTIGTAPGGVNPILDGTTAHDDYEEAISPKTF